MVRVMALGLLCLCLVACDHRDCTVNIIVPDGFQGGIRIIFEEPGGENWNSDRTFTYSIPPSGTLMATGRNPYSHWCSTNVLTQSGTVIPTAIPAGQFPDEVRFRIVGSTNDLRELWAVIGDNDAMRAVAKQLAHQQSEVLKQTNGTLR